MKSNTTTQRTGLVFGASGLVGRHLILALDAAGVRVIASSRSDSSARRLSDWLAEHQVEDLPLDVRVDYSHADLLPGGAAAFAEVNEIYNCAGAYRFGMSTEDARTANVESVEKLVDFAAQLPNLKRLIHVSGYRVGGQDPSTIPWSPERVITTYRELGAYEASKVESDALLQARATASSVPWSIVNPSSVIGDSRTGESDQQLGLASSLNDLWHAKMPALPGNSTTFVPVVTADYLAKFMSLLPTDPSTTGKSYWILDDRTPPLPDLLESVGQHYRVKVPRLRIPVGALRRLPRRITGADPETLTFLSSDTYPTGAATALAHKHDLHMPESEASILAWADYLAAHRFGDAPAGNRRFTNVGGIRTFELGQPAASRVILPGLPINADTWSRVVDVLPNSRAVDLPGLGMSSGQGRLDWAGWLEALLPDGEGAHLICHSIGAAAALEAVSANPARVSRLTLVSPFFLQAPAGATARIRPVTTAYLRRVQAGALAERLTGNPQHAAALESTVTDLRRPGTASRVARLLALAANTRWRIELQQKLANFKGDLEMIVGEHDPLSREGHALLASLPNATITVIPGAGHHLQLTHPAELAEALQVSAETPEPASLGA